MNFDQLIALWRTLPANQRGGMMAGENEGDQFNKWAQALQQVMGFGSFNEIPDEATVRAAIATPQFKAAGSRLPADLLAAYTTALATNPNLPADDFAISWADANPRDPRLNDPAFKLSVGIEDNNPDPGSPDEPAFYNQIAPRIREDLENDARRQTETTKIVGDVNRSLDDAVKVNSELLRVSGFDAERYIADDPGIRTALQQLIEQGKATDLASAAKYHYDTWGKTEGRTPYYTRSRLDEEYAQADLSNNRLAGSANAEAAARLAGLDKRKADIETALTALQGARTGALTTETAALYGANGQLLADRAGALTGETAALRDANGRLLVDRTKSLDEQLVTLRGALDQLNVERSAALAPLEAARMVAAESQATAINQALETQRDQMTAANATRGFVGGSTAESAAIARAVVGARQASAQAVGDAGVANAGDRRSLGDDIAGTRFGITGQGAADRRGINDDSAVSEARIAGGAATGLRTLLDDSAKTKFNITGNAATGLRGIVDDSAKGRFNLSDSDATARVAVNDARADGVRTAADNATGLKQNYFDADFGRRLEASLRPAQIATTRLNFTNAADEAGQAGLNRSLRTLAFFQGNNAPPPSSSFTRTPSTSGADLAALGASSVNAALNIANANKWFTKTETPKVTLPAASTLKFNTNPMKPGGEFAGFTTPPRKP